MKKFLPLLLILISSIFIFSCKDDDDDVQVQVEYPAVYDLNATFSYNDTDGWNYYQKLDRAMLNEDYILIFRQSGSSNGNPIWQQIPRTLFIPEGELDYDFDFTKLDFFIYAGGTINFANQSQVFKDAYLNNQRFRVVLVPAVNGFNNKNTVDPRTLSYEEVIAKYNIDDSKIGKL